MACFRLLHDENDECSVLCRKISVCEALGQLNTTKQPVLFLLQEKYWVKDDSAAIYKSTVQRVL